MESVIGAKAKEIQKKHVRITRKRVGITGLGPNNNKTYGQWWSIFKMHLLQMLQWWARSGLKLLHLRHIRFGGRGLGFGFKASISPLLDLLTPLFLASRRLVSSSIGNGSASGGIEPGSVVIAWKWDTTASTVTVQKANEWNSPHFDSFIGVHLMWKITDDMQNKWCKIEH